MQAFPGGFPGAILLSPAPLPLCNYCQTAAYNVSTVQLGSDLTVAVMTLFLPPSHTCWVKILRGSNEAWSGLWTSHSSMSQDSRLWQEELPRIQGGTAAPLVTKCQAHSSTVAQPELSSSCGRHCSMNSASPAGVSCARALSSVLWSLQGNGVKPPRWGAQLGRMGRESCQLHGGEPHATKPVLTFCVFSTQRKFKLRLISVKFCRGLSFQSLYLAQQRELKIIRYQPINPIFILFSLYFHVGHKNVLNNRDARTDVHECCFYLSSPLDFLHL